MLGLMQDKPLLISDIITYAETYHPLREVIWRTASGSISHSNYSTVAGRAKKLANALRACGIKTGDRVATLATNSTRHLELYYGVSGIGAILHTVNPRLYDEQLVYIINHAEDRMLFVDPELVPILLRLRGKLPRLERIFILGDVDKSAVKNLELENYDDFIEPHPAAIAWPSFDERTASSLCYTSGTTGNPKGVLYSHRSTVLHAMNAAHTNAYGISIHDVAMPLTPMFHVNAGGLPYIAPLCGAALVLIGPKIDGEIMQSLIESEGVSFTTGVPTMVTMLMEYLDRSGKRIDSLKRAVIGGSSVPAAMIDRMRTQYGCKIMQLWGMTETSPVGALCTETPAVSALPEAARREIMLKAGRVLFGMEVKLVGDESLTASPEQSRPGALWVRGPWTAKAYFKQEDPPILDKDGWFPTGDVAALDEYGFLQILDRTKDVIKSGGEWISSIDIENMVCGHPEVRQAAVIGVHHPKWEERPLLIIVPVPGSSPTKEGLLDYLRPRIASWWMPDDVVVIDDMPMTATGKIRKASLREKFAGYQLREKQSSTSSQQLRRDG